MREGRRQASGGRKAVKEMLADVLADASGTDEFAHGLFSFLGELSARDPDHPLLSRLADDLGRKGSEAAAAGILHDLRALLQVMSAHLDIMNLEMASVFDPARLDPGRRVAMFARFAEGLGAARTAATDAAAITESGRRIYGDESERADAAEVLDAAVATGRRMIPGRVELMREGGVSGGLDARRAEVLRVLLNLIRNAGDAVEGVLGGLVIVSSWSTEEMAFIQVTDTGPGIPKGSEEQIFDLFFTTKGSGTGIGLFVCKRLVEGWGGQIVVDTPRRGGAAFTISIPRAAGPSVV